MSKIRSKLIFILSVAQISLILLFIILLYFTFKVRVFDFNKNSITENKKIFSKLIQDTKQEGKKIISQSNDKISHEIKQKVEALVTKVESEQNMALANIIVTSLDMKLKSIEGMVTSTARTPIFYWQYEYKQKEILTQYIKDYKVFKGFRVYSENGDFMFKIGSSIDVKNEKEFILEKNLLLNYFEKNNTGDFILSVPVLNEESRYRGSLVSEISLVKIVEEILKNNGIGDKREVYFLDENMNVFSQSKDSPDINFYNLKINKKKETQQFKATDGNLYTVIKYSGGIKLYVVLRAQLDVLSSDIDFIKLSADNTIKNEFNTFDKNVLAQIKLSDREIKDTAETNVNSFFVEISGIIYFMIITAIIASIMIGILVAERITDPVNKISDIAKDIGEGMFEPKFDEKLFTGNDEISHLAKELSGMGKKLKNNILEIKELERNKANAERLVIIGQVASGIVHEIKNPLTSIYGYAQVIIETTEDPQIKRGAKIIIDESERMNKLAHELLNYAKPLKLEIENISVRQLIERTLETLKVNINNKKITVETIFDENLKNINNDRNKIIQVLMNLMSNAIDAVQAETGKIVITAGNNEDGIFIKIADNGSGIPDRILEKIFLPFVSAKRGGTGLGLAIAKKIVDDLGGNISFITEKDKGTEFKIVFSENSKI